MRGSNANTDSLLPLIIAENAVGQAMLNRAASLARPCRTWIPDALPTRVFNYRLTGCGKRRLYGSVPVPPNALARDSECLGVRP